MVYLKLLTTHTQYVKLCVVTPISSSVMRIVLHVCLAYDRVRVKSIRSRTNILKPKLSKYIWLGISPYTF